MGPGSFQYTWKINNFSRLTVRKLYSDVFIAGSCKWRILVFPKGNSVDYLSIYLEVADAASLPDGWNRDASFSLAVINQFNAKSTVLKETQNVFHATVRDWGFSTFMPLTVLRDPTARFLVNDTLTVEAGVHVRSAKFYSVTTEPVKQDVKDEPKLPEPQEKQDSLPEKDAKDEVRVPKAQEKQDSLPQKDAKDEVKVPDQVVEKGAKRDPTSEPIQTSPNVQTISQNLLTEISSRTRAQKSVSSYEIAFAGKELSRPEHEMHQQKEALQGFFNMSLEAIRQADAFGNIEKIIVSLLEQASTLQEKTILEDLASRLAEFKESVPNISSTEIVEARRIALAEKTTHLNERLEQRQKELSSADAEYSKIAKEEANVEAEIQRLMAKKKELISQKNRAAIELEKANEEASKDLAEWGSLEKEVKQANNERRQAKEKLALANIRWKLFKEDLGLGKLSIV